MRSIVRVADEAPESICVFCRRKRPNPVITFKQSLNESVHCLLMTTTMVTLTLPQAKRRNGGMEARLSPPRPVLPTLTAHPLISSGTDSAPYGGRTG